MSKQRANILALVLLLAIAAGGYGAVWSGDHYADLRGPNALSSYGINGDQLLVASDDRLLLLRKNDGAIVDQVPLATLGFADESVSDLHSIADGTAFVMTFWSGHDVVRCQMSNHTCQVLTHSEDAQFNKFTFNPHDGHLFVSDMGHGLVRELDIKGETIATTPPSKQHFLPGDLALDQNQQIYAVDLGTGNVQMLSGHDDQGNIGVSSDTLELLSSVLDIDATDAVDALTLQAQTLYPLDDGSWLVLMASSVKEGGLLLHLSKDWKTVLHHWKLANAVFPVQMDISDQWFIADPEGFFIFSRDSRVRDGAWALFGDANVVTMMDDLRGKKQRYLWMKYAAWGWCLTMLLLLLWVNSRTNKSTEESPHWQQESSKPTKHSPFPKSTKVSTLGVGVYHVQDRKRSGYMIMSNLETVPGRRVVRHLGVVTGSTVRSKHVGRDLMAGIKNIFGGELKGYTELLQESREEAVKRLAKQAESMGANAVLNIRFSTSSIAQGAAELFAYGTAVVLE